MLSVALIGRFDGHKLATLGRKNNVRSTPTLLDHVDKFVLGGMFFSAAFYRIHASRERS